MGTRKSGEGAEWSGSLMSGLALFSISLVRRFRRNRKLAGKITGHRRPLEDCEKIAMFGKCPEEMSGLLTEAIVDPVASRTPRFGGVPQLGLISVQSR